MTDLQGSLILLERCLYDMYMKEEISGVKDKSVSLYSYLYKQKSPTDKKYWMQS